jgi:hypothetical protein
MIVCKMAHPGPNLPPARETGVSRGKFNVFSRALIGLAMSGLVLASCTDGTSSGSSADRHVTINNNTGSTISRFYGSNAGSNSWEEDILGADVLPSGSSTTINFDDGTGYCTFDFKAVLSDGRAIVESGVDVCTTSAVTFN